MSDEDPDDDRTRAFVTLAPGVRVLHYKIIEKIGAGGMGEVYAAEDSSLGRKVALKFLPLFYATDTGFRDRFKREAEATARLNHPSIVTIHEVGEYQGRPYFAMELVEGQSLKQYLKSQDLTLETVLDLAVQLCDGLAAAHEKQVTHRDIKPSNILIDQYGRPKILDFGLAAIEGDEALTRTGSTLGTVQYMSPEQTLGSGVDHRSDIFSFGVVLYEMITGRNPFVRDNTIATGQAIVGAVPEPLGKYRGEVPELLQAVVSKMLEKDPALRYQSAVDLMADLKRMVRDVDSGSSTRILTASSLPAAARRKGTTWKFAAGAAVVALALISLIVYWLPSFRADSPGEGGDAVAESEWKSSIAVLPFRDFSPAGDQEFFCDGITDAIISRLSSLHDLKVISMTSVMQYKSPDRDLREIGDALGVAAILEGSVQREGDRIRIRTQLIRVEDDAHLWSQTYDKEIESIFAVQDEISYAIVGALKIELLGAESTLFTRQSTENPEAYNYYSQGRFFWRKRTEEHLRTAIESFEKAIELDSGYALAWAGLADAWTVLPGYSNLEVDDVLPTARKAAARALELDANLAEAHASLGLILHFEDDYDAAEQEFLRAIELNPGYVWTHTWYATTLASMNRPEDAMRELELSLELDPLNIVSMMKVARHRADHFEWDAALKLYRRAIQIEPSPAIIRSYADVLVRVGRYHEAITLLEQAVRDYPGYTAAYRSLSQLYAEFGQMDKIIDLLERFSEAVDDAHAVAFWQGSAHHMLGELSQAVEKFREATALDPERTFVWLSLADVYTDLGDFDEAIEAVDAYASSVGWDVNSLIFRGTIYMMKGDLSRAADDFEDALNQAPDNTQAMLLTAMVDLYRGRYENVKTVASQFAQSNDAETRAEAAELLALVELIQGHMNRAQEIIDSGLVADSLDGRFYEMRGMLLAKAFVHEELGELEEALGATRRVRAISSITTPNDQLAWRDYEAQILARMARYDEARAVAESLKADIVAGGKALDISAYWQTLAAIEMAAGNYSAAVEQMRIACDSTFDRSSTNYLQAHYMMAQAYLGADKVADAISEFEPLLDSYGSNRAVAEVWMLRARYLLGTAYERAGRTTEAIVEYQGLLEQLSSADEGYQLVADTRARLDRLRN